MGFSRQEYWKGWPFPPPGDLPDPGIKPTSPALQADFLLLSHQRSSIWHGKSLFLPFWPYIKYTLSTFTFSFASLLKEKFSPTSGDFYDKWEPMRIVGEKWYFLTWSLIFWQSYDTLLSISVTCGHRVPWYTRGGWGRSQACSGFHPSLLQHHLPPSCLMIYF